MSTTITGCLRQSDGQLTFTDTSCDVELPACLGASGQLLVYHEDCDGVGESDGWFEVCLNADGTLQIEIPDCCECCPATITTSFPDIPSEHQVFSLSADENYCLVCQPSYVQSYVGTPIAGSWKKRYAAELRYDWILNYPSLAWEAYVWIEYGEYDGESWVWEAGVFGGSSPVCKGIYTGRSYRGYFTPLGPDTVIVS